MIDTGLYYTGVWRSPRGAWAPPRQRLNEVDAGVGTSQVQA